MISVIIPNYNKALFIAETLNSLMSQSFTNWEAIIIDDCSTDDSIAIIKQEIQDDKRFNLILNKSNRGGSYSRNQGIKKAKGEYIVFLDSDDILSDDCLARRHKAMYWSEFDFIVFPMGTFYQKLGDSESYWIPKAKSNHLELFLIHKLPWSIMQTIWRKDFLLLLSGFDEDYPRLQDVELHTRALLNNNVKYKIIKTDIVDCYYRIDEDRIKVDLNHFIRMKYQGIDLYIKKISNIAPMKTKLLRGTFFTFYSELLYHKINNLINKSTFDFVSNKLFNDSIQNLDLNKKSKLIIQVYTIFYYFRLFKIKGYNFIFKRLFLYF